MPQANEILLITIALQIYHVTFILRSMNQQVPPRARWRAHPVGGMKDPPLAFTKSAVGPSGSFSDIPRLCALHN